MAAPDFWSNRERAQADVEEVSRLRSLINPFQELEREIEDFSALHELAAEESDPTARAHAEKEVAVEHDRLLHRLEEFELRQFFSGENDRANALIARMHFSRFIRVLVVPSHAIGPTYCCGCISAGLSEAGSNRRRWTFNRGKKSASNRSLCW